MRRLSFLLAALALMLVSFGGHVTTLQAGDTEPAWSLRFWQWFVPWSELQGGHFFEMTHRQLGAIVGIVTIGLVVVLRLWESRARVRWLGYGVLGLVVVQGLLGGLRVHVVSNPELQTALMNDLGLSDPDTLRVWAGMIHANLGLILFALLSVLVTVQTVSWRASPMPVRARMYAGLKILSGIGALALVIQVAMGAWLRHGGWSTGIILFHVFGALIVTGGVVGIAMLAFGLDKALSAIRLISFTMLAVVQVQLILGVVAFAVPQWAGTQTLHHVTGALLFALGAVVWVRVRHDIKPDAAYEKS